MRIRSKEWFYKQCLNEIQGYKPFSHLCWDLLQKGIGQKDSTRGHVTQAIGATQRFLNKYPNHRSAVQKMDRTKPAAVSTNPTLAGDLESWLSAQSGKLNKRFGYDFDTLKGLLTPALGGTRKGGGGGNDEFKRVLRVMAEFLDRR